MQSAWRLIKRILLVLFIGQFIYILFCKWVDPPVTITQLASIFQGNGLNRDYVRIDEMSAAMKLAVIASEDQLFPDHDGFDIKAIKKAIKYNQKHPNRRRGASTISQQVAKNVFLWQGSGIGRYIRKIPEAYFTKVIEWVWGKQRILDVYLNIAEMGEGIFGIEAASQAYFSKPAIKLNRAEAAMIIACLPSPKRFTVKPMSGWVAWRHPRIMQQMRFIEEDPDVQKLAYVQKAKEE